MKFTPTEPSSPPTNKDCFNMRYKGMDILQKLKYKKLLMEEQNDLTGYHKLTLNHIR